MAVFSARASTFSLLKYKTLYERPDEGRVLEGYESRCLKLAGKARMLENVFKKVYKGINEPGFEVMLKLRLLS